MAAAVSKRYKYLNSAIQIFTVALCFFAPEQVHPASTPPISIADGQRGQAVPAGGRGPDELQH